MTPAPETPLRDGMIINVSHAVNLSISVDGSEFAARTREATVKDVLAEYQISLGEEDVVAGAGNACCSGHEDLCRQNPYRNRSL